MIRSHAFRKTLSAVALGSLVAGCSGGGSNPGPSATPTPTPTPTTGPNASAYTCASSDTVASVGVRSGADEASVRRSAVRKSNAGASAATGLIAVDYAGTSLDTRAKSLAIAREGAASARLVRELSFTHINKYQRILHVTPGTEASAIALLRRAPGVIAASMTGVPRSGQTVAQKYFTNDPYYAGFTQAALVTAGSTSSATYHVDPYEESSSVPGQWGMHATRLDYAQEYSQSGNGSGITNLGALGSSNVNIAIIDSGQDSTHPELSSKIVRQRCFLTNPQGQQSSSSYSVDQDGHGTDVSGIAGAAANNNLGFTGSGGLASIFAYQIFPTPDDSCVIGKSNPDAQCDASSADIASAVNDAVSAGANVINLSLGGGTCTGGVDPDISEGDAIANAIAANVVVVAASGNDAPKTSGVSAPGCDTGVIAVGASALSDGVANGSSASPAGSASSPVEYVASYSEYGSPAASPANANAWGIVAPGGDPSDADSNPNATTTDDLHWIENIWTSTPLDSNFAAGCNSDLGNPGGQADCRTLIAGTSQATPLVAGAVALIIAANPSYQSPSKMKQLLCSTAHDIGDPHEGCGRLDIYRAMATAVGDSNLPASQ